MTVNYISWNVDPVIFTIFGVSLRYYSVLFTGGLLLCIYMLSRIFKRENIPLAFLEKLSIYGVIGILIGARLAHCLFYEPGYYFAHPLEIILPIQKLASGGYKFIGYQGLASHGGALGVIIALILYSLKTKQSLIKTLDLIAIVAPLEGCFIRLGNLMNSEIYGFETKLPWGFIFLRNGETTPKHPTQIYEALSYLLILFIALFLYKKIWPKVQNGFFFGLSLTLIFIARFFIEFIKERQVPFENNLTIDMGQILSIPYIIIGIGFIVYGVIKSKKKLDLKTG
jgi:phosphatidylglycerol---prolipoprotein diacylglyceryl transferase